MSETHDSTSLQSSVAGLVRSPSTTYFRAFRELLMSYVWQQDINPKLISIISGAKKSATWLIESSTHSTVVANDDTYDNTIDKKAA